MVVLPSLHPAGPFGRSLTAPSIAPLITESLSDSHSSDVSRPLLSFSPEASTRPFTVWWAPLSGAVLVRLVSVVFPVAGAVRSFPFGTNGVAGADLDFSIACCASSGTMLAPKEDGGRMMVAVVRLVIPLSPFGLDGEEPVGMVPFTCAEGGVRLGVPFVCLPVPFASTGMRSPFVGCRPVAANVPMCVVRTGLLPGDGLPWSPNELRLWLDPSDVRRRAVGAPGPVGVDGALLPAILCLTEDSCV